MFRWVDKYIKYFEQLTSQSITRDHITSFVMSTFNSFIKVASPLAFGKSIGMLVKAEDAFEVFSIKFSPTELMYLSMSLTTWSLIEAKLRALAISNTSNQFTQQMSQNLTKKSHRIKMSSHGELMKSLIGAHFSIQGQVSELPELIVNRLIPAFIDIMVGVGLIWCKYGIWRGLEFSSYALFTLTIYDQAIIYLLKVNKVNKRLSTARNEYLENTYEVASYARTVRLHNKQDHEIVRSNVQLNELLSVTSQQRRIDSIHHLFTLLPQFIMNIKLIFNISNLNNTDNKIEESIFILTFFNIFCLSISNLSSSLSKTSELFDSLDQIEKIHELKEENNQSDQKNLRLERKLLSHTSRPIIEFINVGVSFNGESVLSKLSFSIFPGEMVAIVGKVGSGKSTIANLIMKFLEPDEGIILTDGQKYTSVSCKEIRDRIAYVPQEPHLFKRTIKENILYGSMDSKLNEPSESSLLSEKKNYGTFDIEFGNSLPKPDESDEKCIMLMKNVGLFKHIDKIHHKIGYVELSGGQKQLLSVAQSLAKNNGSLLIYDEPTSALDSFTEAELLTTISKIMKGKTSIVIAHRLSTIMKANRILVLENGRITEEGSHEYLLSLKGSYYDYWTMQSLAYCLTPVNVHSRT